jgi:hypothetical protein
MRLVHKVISLLVFLPVFIVSYFYDLRFTELVVQNLVTFFSIAFGFYMTCLAILYDSPYLKKLYDEIDPLKPSQRKIHRLKKYFAISSKSSLASISALLVYSISAKNNDAEGLLDMSLGIIPIQNVQINLDALLSGFLAGCFSLNILFLLLFLNFILDGLIQNAKK